MSKTGLYSIIVGALVIILALFSDLIVGKGTIILGPKSYTLIVLGILFILGGAVFFKNKEKK